MTPSDHDTLIMLNPARSRQCVPLGPLWSCQCFGSDDPHLPLYQTLATDPLGPLQAIELDPKFAKAYGRLAKAYFQVGDIPRALDKYREAVTLEINPDLKKEMDVVEMVRICYGKSRDCLERKVLFLLTITPLSMPSDSKIQNYFF